MTKAVSEDTTVFRRMPAVLERLHGSSSTELVDLCNCWFDDELANDDPEFWLTIGTVAHSNGFVDEAIECLQRARRMDPANHVAVANLAAILGMEKRHSEAIELIQSVPKKGYRRSIIHANILYDMQRFRDAIPLYEEAIQQEPEFYLPYAKLLDSLQKSGSPIYNAWLYRAIKAQPKAPDVAVHFVRQCWNQGNYQELADATWLEEVEVIYDKTVPESYAAADRVKECKLYHWAAAAHTSGDRKPLVYASMLLEVAGRERTLCEPSKALVVIAANMGEPEIVSIAYNNICQECIEKGNGLETRLSGYQATALARKGDHQAAAAKFELALKKQPDFPPLLQSYWWTLDEAGSLDEAIVQAKRLLEIAPDWEDLNYNLGYLFGKAGKYAEAIQHYRAELAADNSNWAAWENLSFAMLVARLPESGPAFASFVEAIRSKNAAMQADEANDGTHVSAQLSNSFSLDLDQVSEDHLDMLLISKQDKFELLKQFAETNQTSPTFVNELVNLNLSSDPIIGAQTALFAQRLTASDLLELIGQGHRLDPLEIDFQKQLDTRNDVSRFATTLDSEVRGWRILTAESQLSLLEGEQRFQADSSLDPMEIVSFAKAAEIAINEFIFVPFQKMVLSQADKDDVLSEADAKGQTQMLAKFVNGGKRPTLGQAVFILDVASRPKARKVKLLHRFWNYLSDERGMAALADDQFIPKLSKLVENYGNAERHQFVLSRDETVRARLIAFEALNHLLAPLR